MIPNAYCKRHDETEPQTNTELWTCPMCSKENQNSRADIERALAAVEAQLITKEMFRRNNDNR